MIDVRDVAQRQLAIDRASSAGLWTPDMPAGVPPEMVYLSRRLSEAKLTADVGPLRPTIERAIQDVGMPTSEPWVYLIFGRFNHSGVGFVSGQVVAPARVVGRAGLVPIPFSSPYEWKDDYRDFVFELFGRRIASEEVARHLPPGALFRVDVKDDPELDGPHTLGIEVWRARVMKSGARIHGRGDWRPEWTAVTYSYGGVVPGDSNNTRVADAGLRLLRDIPKQKPGPTPGTVKATKYKTPQQWHAAIREKVLTKETRLSTDDGTIAYWLGISTATMYRLMRAWGPKLLEDLRNGKF